MNGSLGITSIGVAVEPEPAPFPPLQHCNRGHQYWAAHPHDDNDDNTGREISVFGDSLH